MIVVDTSALVAIALDEPRREACIAALRIEAFPAISAATLAEALIVASRRGFRSAVENLIVQGDFEIVPADEATARAALAAYDRWGKGVHRANLNILDCFAYALAKAREWPLLYVGNDFALTDIRAAAA